MASSDAARNVAGSGDLSHARPAAPDRPGAREKLLQAAGRAFMERGYSGTSIDDIAGVIDATKGAVYHHFSSKADIYLAVQERAIERIDRLVRPIFRDDLPVEEKLYRMAREHLMAIFTDFPGAKVAVEGLERSVMTAAGLEERRRLRRLIAQRNDYERMFRTTIERGIAEGVFVDEPGGILGRGVLGALNWSTLWFDPNRTKSVPALTQLAEKLSAFAVRGVSK